jgi:murein DD-endopeptidase MepM/ murein hydrolase activator NlpD
MKRFSVAALAAAMLLMGVPVAFADEALPTTTTTSTTVPAPTTTTAAPAPVGEAAPSSEANSDEIPVDDAAADVAPPADEPRVPKHQVRRIDVTRKIVFPVVGPNYYYPGFGACRDDCEREHHGIDIMTHGWKGVPVVAAHDGTIRKVRDDREWCIVEITAPDRWYTRYVHLNNDTPGYDDEAYECLLPGIEPGAWVEAGQIIGWIGDSGNAEWTPPHVHFEIRTPSGLPVDPYKSLKAAYKIRFQRTGTEDPAETAAEIAGYSYRDGSGVVNVMATTDYETFRNGGLSEFDLSGPLLLSEPDHLPDVTIEMFDQLGADRVIIVGDGLALNVIDQLETRFSIVVRTAMPGPMVESDFGPNIGDVVETVTPERSPFSLTVIGDHSDLPDGVGGDLADIQMRLPTTILRGSTPARRIGRSATQGPGRSGSKHVLYYQTGDGYTRIRAAEAPEEAPDYGVIVLKTAETSGATLTFLRSLADLPVMPLWR